MTLKQLLSTVALSHCVSATESRRLRLYTTTLLNPVLPFSFLSLRLSVSRTAGCTVVSLFNRLAELNHRVAPASSWSPTRLLAAFRALPSRAHAVVPARCESPLLSRLVAPLAARACRSCPGDALCLCASTTQHRELPSCEFSSRLAPGATEKFWMSARWKRNVLPKASRFRYAAVPRVQ
eukprot:5688861-Prymnesium_polylepis.1